MPTQLGNTMHYTADEVSVALDKHLNTVKGYLQSGELKAQKVNGAWLVARKDLALFLSESQSLPESMIDHRLGITSPKTGKKLQPATN